MDTTDEYIPHKKSADKKSPWFYFVIHITNKTKAKCKLCNKPIQCNGGSTSGLHTHLRAIHHIVQKHGIEDNEDNGPESKKQKTKASQPLLTKFVVNNKSETLCEVFARMAARDGLSFNVLASSGELKKGLAARKFEKIPSCPNTVKSMVFQYERKVREELIAEFNKRKSEGERFSVTLDEWTSNRNRRYMNVNIHAGSDVYNLGLIRATGSVTAKKCVELLQRKLAQFKIDLDADIVDVTSDGASVMKKLGKLIDAEQQLCFAHAIHLAVLDVMYKKKPKKKTGSEENSEDNIEDNSEVNGEDSIEDNSEDNSDNESEYDSEDETEESGDGVMIVEEEDEETSLSCSELEKLIKKVRKVVYLFKRSAKKNEVYLQKYVKAEFPDKDLVLLPDVKTRWNSLVTMLERFLKLRNCVQKALIDMKSEIAFTEGEFKLLTATMEALAPIKVAVESLCRRDANLLLADTVIDFMITDLAGQQTEISQKLREAIIARILERRTDISQVLQFLHDGEQENNELCKKLSKPAIARIIMRLIKRLYPNPEATSEEETDGSSAESTSEESTCVDLEEPSLKEKLNRAIQDKLNRPKTAKKFSSLEQTILQEVSFFKDHKVRGPNLQKAYQLLKTIPPTSVESERAFSTANNFCTKLRSRLGDDSIDKLCFLRAHFLRTDK